MGNSKSKPARSSLAAWIRVLLRPHNRGLALTALVLMAAVSGLVYAWQRWGEPAMKAADYGVTPERLAVTPQPEWIHSDVKAEVVRAAGLTRLNLRDRKLVEQVARAFALHPWVSRVVQVQKRFPTEVRVELLYRRPVAAVEVKDRGESRLLFIDAESVLLPTHDFASVQGKEFLRIAAGNETPAGGYGTAWGGEPVAGAARLAAAWGSRWQPLGLYRIVGLRSPDGQLVYELHTQGDVRILWGSAPGRESPREPSPEQKIAALEHFIHDKGPLDRDGGPALLDLRELAGAAAKTASQGKANQR